METNFDHLTVIGFGEEWEAFNQSELDPKEKIDLFNAYFAIFPWGALPANAVGFDLGSGSGRWASLAASKAGKIHCIDPSAKAISVAKRNLAQCSNCEFHNCTIEQVNIDDSSMDFGYSLGVLHHVPDTTAALRKCANLLKKMPQCCCTSTIDLIISDFRHAVRN